MVICGWLKKVKKQGGRMFCVIIKIKLARISSKNNFKYTKIQSTICFKLSIFITQTRKLSSFQTDWTKKEKQLKYASFCPAPLQQLIFYPKKLTVNKKLNVSFQYKHNVHRTHLRALRAISVLTVSQSLSHFNFRNPPVAETCKSNKD